MKEFIVIVGKLSKKEMDEKEKGPGDSTLGFACYAKIANSDSTWFSSTCGEAVDTVLQEKDPEYQPKEKVMETVKKKEE